jgi:quercetin dioxygenase-like cupin family protein
MIRKEQHENTAERGAARVPERLDGPFLSFDLEWQIDHLRQEDYWQSGHNSKTLIHYPDFRMVLVAIRSDTHIREHRAAGRISVETLDGHIRMRAGNLALDLRKGHLLVLDREMPYDIEALEDSAFLLTLAWPTGEET